MAAKILNECAAYLDYLVPVNQLDKSVRKAVAALKKYDFDSIAFRGMSGALIAPAIALRMKKSLLMVRKHKTETSHSKRKVEGNVNSRRYVIVDDVIATGNTVITIVKDVKNFAKNGICIGVLEIVRVRENTRVTLSQVPKKPNY